MTQLVILREAQAVSKANIGNLRLADEIGPCADVLNYLHHEEGYGVPGNTWEENLNNLVEEVKQFLFSLDYKMGNRPRTVATGVCFWLFTRSAYLLYQQENDDVGLALKTLAFEMGKILAL